MGNHSGTFHSTDPIEAQRYDGSRASADEIAAAFGLRVVEHTDGLAAVFKVLPPLSINPAQEHTNHDEFAAAAGCWVWRNQELDMIGGEWDHYFREHFTAIIPSV